METKRQTEQRFREVDVPEQIMTEVAGIIAESGIQTNIFGIGEQPKSVSIGFYYTTDLRGPMMEILEVIEDFYSDEE